MPDRASERGCLSRQRSLSLSLSLPATSSYRVDLLQRTTTARGKFFRNGRMVSQAVRATSARVLITVRNVDLSSDKTDKPNESPSCLGLEGREGGGGGGRTPPPPSTVTVVLLPLVVVEEEEVGDISVLSNSADLVEMSAHRGEKLRRWLIKLGIF